MDELKEQKEDIIHIQSQKDHVWDILHEVRAEISVIKLDIKVNEQRSQDKEFEMAKDISNHNSEILKIR